MGIREAYNRAFALGVASFLFIAGCGLKFLRGVCFSSVLICLLLSEEDFCSWSPDRSRLHHSLLFSLSPS